ncbi:lipopolysaccharide heptosyltransferase family protein [Flavobacteriaceae bacterium]|nr:lipopolysaccharide heptosyltransferase family protein [Flavobacteriaceae bacterium]
MNPKPIKKILVIQQKMIGDVLISSVLCSHLKALYPEAQLHYAIHQGTLAVVKGHPDIDQFILSTPKKSWNQWRILFTQIKKERYDLILDAYGKLESLMMILPSGAPRVYGHKKWFSPLAYTKTSMPSSQVYTTAGNALEDRLRLIYPESEIQESALEFRPKIHLTSEEISWGQEIIGAHNLDRGKTLVMVSILGSSLDKSLPAQTMAQIIDTLAQQPNTHILLNYVPNQKHSVDEILALVPEKNRARVHPEIYAQNLREFLALLSQAHYLVGNEGGAVNMAKALNIPTFTLFSPWINKVAWNSFDDGQTHVGLHLKDFAPDLFQGQSNKEVRKNHQQFYQAFTFDLFAPLLNSFCLRHSSKEQ